MTSLVLSYIPVNTASIHVYLNGVEQYEPLDWTFDPVGNKIDSESAMDERAGDLLEARYAHHGIVALEPPRATPVLVATSKGQISPALTMDLVLPHGILADDLLLLFGARWDPSIVTGGYIPLYSDSTGGAGIVVAYKIASGPAVIDGGPEINPTFNYTANPAGSNFNGAAVAVYRNIDTGAPLADYASDFVSGLASSAFVDVPTVNADSASQIVVYFVYQDSGQTTGEGYIFAPSTAEREAFGPSGRFYASISDELTTGPGATTAHTLHDSHSDSSTDHQWHMLTVLLNGDIL